MKAKQELRSTIKKLSLLQSREELGIQNTSILKQILEYIDLKNIRNICIYENMDDEVDTKQLIVNLKALGVNIYTPQVISPTEMIIIDKDFEVYEKGIDIFVIPARAYTKQGKRLGRGKGYYDRFLSQKLYKHSKKIGICYDFQLVESLPVEKHDILMNKIITYSSC